MDLKFSFDSNLSFNQIDCYWFDEIISPEYLSKLKKDNINNDFSIGTLTHDRENGIDYLAQTVHYFISNTNMPNNKKVNWHVMFNGKYSNDFIKTVQILANEYSNKIVFYIHSTGKNLGPGPGINRLNEWLKNYKYSLFLEGDWLTLDYQFTPHGKDWLIKCLDLMEKENLDQVQLRKFIHDVDMRQYGFAYWIQPSNITKEENGLVYLKERDYTNNPHIRKNQSYFDNNIFPLDEFYDENGNPTELKGNSDWGQAEIKAELKGRILKSAWLKGGIMIHLDGFGFNNWEHVKDNISGCDYNDTSLLHCKYGFMFPRKDFCNFCYNTKDFSDLNENNIRFEESLRQN